KIERTHCFTQAMHHEPCALVADLKHAMHLVSADALLARRHKKQGCQPFRQRNFAALKDRADRDCELLAAFVALVEAGTMLRSVKLGHVLRGDSTMRTNRTSRPHPSLQPLTGFGLIVEDRVL